MKTKLSVTVLVVAIIGLVIGATDRVRAQPEKPRPAYVFAEVEADPSRHQDASELRRYATEAPKSIAAFGGRYVVRGGKVEGLEGEAPSGYIVIIGFESLEKARAWYSSPAYEAIKPIRQQSTKSRLLLLEGTSETK